MIWWVMNAEWFMDWCWRMVGQIVRGCDDWLLFQVVNGCFLMSVWWGCCNFSRWWIWTGWIFAPVFFRFCKQPLEHDTTNEPRWDHDFLLLPGCSWAYMRSFQPGEDFFYLKHPPLFGAKHHFSGLDPHHLWVKPRHRPRRPREMAGDVEVTTTRRCCCTSPCPWPDLSRRSAGEGECAYL